MPKIIYSVIGFCFGSLILFLPLITAASEKTMAELQIYRVIPFESYSEEPGLPPKLMVHFAVNCSQKILQVLRYEDSVSVAGKEIIVIGALVTDKINKICDGHKIITVEAGRTFSGRAFDVVSMQR